MLESALFAPARSLGRCKEMPVAKESMCPDFHSQLEKIRSDKAFRVSGVGEWEDSCEEGKQTKGLRRETVLEKCFEE